MRGGFCAMPAGHEADGLPHVPPPPPLPVSFGTILRGATCEGCRRTCSLRPGERFCSSCADRHREHADIRRAEAGPKKEPGCNHRFHPMDQKCVYCRASVEDELSREAHSIDDSIERIPRGAWQSCR